MALIRQWQVTLTIFGSVGLLINAIWYMLDSVLQNQDMSFPLIATFSVGLFTAAWIKGYIEEYVNLEKI